MGAGLPIRLWVAAGVVLTAVVGATAQSPTTSRPTTDDVTIRDYLSANGLLNRGLHELACKEYRKFLAEHGMHEKAPQAGAMLDPALAVALLHADVEQTTRVQRALECA